MTTPTPQEIEALLARLEAVDSDDIGAGLARMWHRNPDGPDAATALRALAAENARLREIERAAGDVLDEVDRILAVDPPPIKYRAPYGTLARLRGALARAALNPTGDDNG